MKKRSLTPVLVSLLSLTLTWIFAQYASGEITLAARLPRQSETFVTAVLTATLSAVAAAVSVWYALSGIAIMAVEAGRLESRMVVAWLAPVTRRLLTRSAMTGAALALGSLPAIAAPADQPDLSPGADDDATAALVDSTDLFPPVTDTPPRAGDDPLMALPAAPGGIASPSNPSRGRDSHGRHDPAQATEPQPPASLTGKELAEPAKRPSQAEPRPARGAGLAPRSAAAAPVNHTDGSYIVHSGDCLWDIVTRLYRPAHAADTAALVAEIVRLNPTITNPDLIYPDTTLTLPKETP
ncbi:MAG: LysM peptidoglycan-binding domain-containing protein [Bowdeniella nasicola]|nr:LysM peptidoglycan-binding domain-containing protein [Bowdeniella nasicola]